MESAPSTSRYLSDAERAILLYVLSADFAGAKELRSQIPSCTVGAAWVEGLPSIDLVIPHTVAAAPVADGQIPVRAEVCGEEGTYLGEICVWVKRGHLASIEYAWVTDNPPKALPATTALTLIHD